MNILQYLNTLRPAIPLSVEKPCTVMSNGELRRLIEQRGVLVNHEPVKPLEELDFPVYSLIFFPKGKRRTTII